MVVDAVMAIGNDDRLNLIGIKKYFADCDIFCAGRVAEEDLNRVAAAAGGTVQTSVNNIIDEVLGTCEVFEEKQVGGERFNIFSGCPSGRTATIVLRGGTDQLVEEAERSLHDAIMRRVVKNSTVVPGGGAIDHSQWFTGCSFSICTGCFVLAPSSVKLPRQKGTQVDSLCVK